MNFGQRQRDPTKHFVGIAAVILFHGFVAYALITGLAKKVIDVVRAPIETKVIEEVKKPPPPPEVVVPPPPKLEAPPPPFIPPPEVQIATPPPPQPTITAVTPTPPPAPVVIAPAPPVAAAPAPAAPPAPAVVSAGVVCPGYQEKVKEAGYPRDANRAGLTRGEAMIEFSLSAGGEVKNVRVVSATHPIFGRYAARQVESEVKCVGQGHEIQTVRIPFSFKLD
ncbi:MAG: TonB family protein [Burkholderiaceae bacterium]|nr:MAG: TonB family protein [Burkholderiaceae bacterium]